MVQINFALREVNCKIVYYGPGLSGKTTNLEIVHKKAPESNKGELTSIATEGDRTLFFDFMPLDLGTIAGMRTRFQLYTVPGQVYYNSTRKLVLQGVDGIVFVADSSAAKMEENLESLENLKNNLAEYGKDIRELPLVIQWNKRDLADALPVDELEARINQWGVPTYEAVAVTGEGVFPTLKCLSGLVLETLNRDQREAPAATAGPGIAAAAPAATAPPQLQASAPASAPRAFGGGAPASAPSPFAAAAGVGTAAPPAIQRSAVGGAPAALGQTQSAPVTSPGLIGDTRPGGLPSGGGGGGLAGGGGGGGGLIGGGGAGWKRKVEATPLESPIRATAPAQAGGPRTIQIRTQRTIPWVAVGLAVLIMVALGVIIVATGLVKVSV